MQNVIKALFVSTGLPATLFHITIVLKETHTGKQATKMNQITSGMFLAMIQSSIINLNPCYPCLWIQTSACGVDL